MADVRPVDASEWETVKAVRLRALQDAPYAFASSYERERSFGEEQWRVRMEGAAWFVAWLDGRAVGVVAGIRPGDGAPDRKEVVAMWVDPAVRGTPAAPSLMAAVRAWAETEGADVLSLWVADGNERARRFYTRLGFQPTGRRQPLPSDPSVGEEELTLPLQPA